MIEARAKMRIADEYDAAQDRGEIQKPGGDRTNIVGPTIVTAGTCWPQGA